MKTPQIPAMPGMSPLGLKRKGSSMLVNDPYWPTIMHRLATDERTIAERQWNKPKLAPKPQKPCDHGLFSDEANQLDLVEMFHEPTND